MKEQYVIVADDNRVTAKLERRYLETAGFKVIEAFDGVDCLEKIDACLAKGDKISCLVIDHMMPRLDGFETIVRIRNNPHYEQPHPIPAMIITALNDITHQLKAIDMGFDDFLAKPLEERLLLAKVKMLCRISSLEEEIIALRQNSPNSASI